MKARAALKLRNDVLLSARKRIRMPQRDVVAATGIPIYVLSSLECRRFDGAAYAHLENSDKRKLIRYARKLAGFFELELEEVLPSLGGVKIRDVTRVTEIQPEQLAALCPGIGSHALSLGMDPSNKAQVNEVTEILDRALDALPQRVAHILRRRNGIGAETASYNDIGRELGISRERCRQIEQKALRDLRDSSDGRVLNDYVQASTQEQMSDF